MSAVDPRSIPGLAHVAAQWVRRRTLTAEHPSLEHLVARKRAEGLRVSVGIPVSGRHPDLHAVGGAIIRDLMQELRLVDELVVLAAGHHEALVLPADASARVVDVRKLMPEVPPAPGRGDSRWRGLASMRGDIIVWSDADTGQLDSSEVTRLVAPLLMDETVGFVKGFHEPAKEFDVEIDGVVFQAGGQRTTELLVRPLINLLFPELGGFFQPLDGACAGRMRVLRELPFFSGCSVDVALLIDALEVLGLDGMAQVHLGSKTGDQRPLRDLAPMAHAIARTIFKRAQERKRIDVPASLSMRPLLVPSGLGVEPVRIDEVERPPMSMVGPYLAALRSSDDGKRPRLLREVRSRRERVGSG